MTEIVEIEQPQIPSSIGKWKTYPVYKDSGVEWLGGIPEHWDKALLKRYLISLKDGTHGTFERVIQGVPLLSAKNVINGQVLVSDRESLISIADYEAINRNGYLRPGDLLLTIVGTIGRAAIFNLSEPVAFQRSVAVLRLRFEQAVRYFYYLTQSSYFQAHLVANTNQSAQGGVYLNIVACLPVVLPSIVEQRIITAFLDRETSKINSLKAKKQHLIELLQEKRAALISHAVTKGLDPDVKMKDSGVEWLREIPAHWKIFQLRRIVKTFVDYRGFTPTKTPHGIPLITARNIRNGTLDFTNSQEFISEEDYDTRMVRGFPKSGDVLITTEAPLGATAQIVDENVTLAQRIILLKVDKLHITNDYLKYYFISFVGQGELWSRATGSTAIGIKASHLREILIIVPPT